MKARLNRIRGTIYGHAIGDALGLGTEGLNHEEIAWKYPNGIVHYRDIFQVLKTDDIQPPKTGIPVHFSCSLS